MGARKLVLMTHSFFYQIVSHAQEASTFFGKTGRTPGCPAGRSPLAKQRLTRFDQVVNFGSKEKIFEQIRNFNDIPSLTWISTIHFHSTFGQRLWNWTSTGEEMWRAEAPRFLMFFNWINWGQEPGQGLVSHLCHLRCVASQSFMWHPAAARWQVEPALIQVHIDHGGAVLKWAEGINDKVGPCPKKTAPFFGIGGWWVLLGAAADLHLQMNISLSLSLSIYIYYITLYVHAYALYDADGLLLEKLWKRGVQEWRPYRCRRPGRYLQCNQARPPTYGLHFSNRGCMLCTCQVRFSWSLKRSTFWMLQVDCRWLMMIVDCKVFFYYMNSLRLDQLNGPPFFLHHAWIHNQCSFSGCSPLSPSSLRPLSQCTAFVNSVHTMYLDVFRNLLALWTPF